MERLKYIEDISNSGLKNKILEIVDNLKYESLSEKVLEKIDTYIERTIYYLDEKNDLQDEVIANLKLDIEQLVNPKEEREISEVFPFDHADFEAISSFQKDIIEKIKNYADENNLPFDVEIVASGSTAKGTSLVYTASSECDLDFDIKIIPKDDYNLDEEFIKTAMNEIGPNILPAGHYKSGTTPIWTGYLIDSDKNKYEIELIFYNPQIKGQEVIELSSQHSKEINLSSVDQQRVKGLKHLFKHWDIYGADQIKEGFSGVALERAVSLYNEKESLPLRGFIINFLSDFLSGHFLNLPTSENGTPFISDPIKRTRNLLASVSPDTWEELNSKKEIIFENPSELDLLLYDHPHEESLIDFLMDHDERSIIYCLDGITNSDLIISWSQTRSIANNLQSKLNDLFLNHDGVFQKVNLDVECCIYNKKTYFTIDALSKPFKFTKLSSFNLESLKEIMKLEFGNLNLEKIQSIVNLSDDKIPNSYMGIIKGLKNFLSNHGSFFIQDNILYREIEEIDPLNFLEDFFEKDVKYEISSFDKFELNLKNFHTLFDKIATIESRLGSIERTNLRDKLIDKFQKLKTELSINISNMENLDEIKDKLQLFEEIMGYSLEMPYNEIENVFDKFSNLEDIWYNLTDNYIEDFSDFLSLQEDI